MERRKLFIVLTVFLAVFFLILYLILFTQLGPKLAGYYKPNYLKDESDIQGTVVCDPVNNLQKCEKDGPCIQCKDGLYSCQTVSGGKFADPNINPEKWVPATIRKPDGSDYQIPDGRWCLATTVDTSTKCNPFTSDPILTKVSDGLYRWRCYCKYPNWISSSGVDGDCDVQIACNHPDNPSENYLAYCANEGNYTRNPTTGKFVCSDGSEPIAWKPDSLVDLEKHSFCVCGEGSVPYQNDELRIKECATDPCGKGTIIFGDDSRPTRCNCPDGYISCDKLPDEKKDECPIGCLVDPCKASGGTYTIKDGKPTCDCRCEEWGPGGPENGACLRGKIFMKDENFLAGGYCEEVNDACKLLLDDQGNSNCDKYRGGTCTTCPTDTGYGTKINVPYCHDCAWHKGFRPNDETFSCEDPKNCQTCHLWFTSCNNDDECCTGRCHEGKTCKPCNDPGLDDDDNAEEKGRKQDSWDRRCQGYNTGRNFCNSYDVTGDRSYTDWSADGLLGFCERGPAGTRY